MTLSEAKIALEKHGQGHVLRFWDDLTDPQRVALLGQIAELDLVSVDRMSALLKISGGGAADAAIQPAPVVTLAGGERQRATESGAALLRGGKVAVILVAGGQGSRLGFEGPKGAFSIGPVSGESLFYFHSRKILALERTFGAAIPFYIMTSEVNDAETRAFFEGQGYFGLVPDRVKFFKQGMWPALTAEGKIILDAPGHIFMSPDGHGGTLAALRRTGMLADMEARGITTVFYFQVDNPLVEVADPAFLGLHAECGADVSLKVCAKRDPGEGLGVVAQRGGQTCIVEYTELTEAQKTERLAGGALRFSHGSVAIHVFDFGFMKREAEAALPLHVAHKKVPYCDETGKLQSPGKPNAYKFEKFIFDVLPDARTVLNLAFDRAVEFSPVKNAVGEDSPETVRRDMVAKYAGWLEACGCKVPREVSGAPAVSIEIDPAYAWNPEMLRLRLEESGLPDTRSAIWLH